MDYLLSATALIAHAKLRTGACKTEHNIDNNPSLPGNLAITLTSSAERALPSIIAPLITTFVNPD